MTGETNNIQIDGEGVVQASASRPHINGGRAGEDVTFVSAAAVGRHYGDVRIKAEPRDDDETALPSPGNHNSQPRNFHPTRREFEGQTAKGRAKARKLAELRLQQIRLTRKEVETEKEEIKAQIRLQELEDEDD